MKYPKRWKLRMKFFACAMVGFMALLSLRQEGRAMIVPAEMTAPAATPLDRQADLEKIQKVLEHKMVKQRLGNIGLNEKEVQERLSKMSDQDVHELASRMDSMVPAGDVGGALIAVLIIVILVLLVIYLVKRV